MTTTEELLQDISTRMQALDALPADIETLKDLTSPEKLRTFVADYFSELDDNDPIVRKIRFGGSEPELIGSKFARHGLNAADIEWLHDYMTARTVLGKAGPSEELTNAFKAVSDAYYISDEEVREIDRRALDDLYPRVPKFQTRGLTREEWVQSQMRAMDTQESGYGQQLVGAQYVGDLWDVSRELGVIAPRIRSFEMSAPTAYLPVEAGFPELLHVGESVDNNSANYGTSKTPSNRASVTAQKFVLHQMWSGEMEEDAIIAFVPFLRQQAARALAFYLDSVVLNGDTTSAATNNINSDDEAPASTKHFLAFDGIRHAALVDNTGNALDIDGAVTLDTFRALRALMRDTARVTDWGHPVDRSDLLFIADPDTSDRIDLLDEVVNAKLRNGNAADLLNGQTASILGHPVIRTMVQPKTEADGKVSFDTPANNTKGHLTAFNVNGAVLGWRRRVKVEVERLPASDQNRIVYSLRLGMGRFTPTGNVNAIEWVAQGYNITV